MNSELMDIVNEKDEVIGSAPRSEIYKKRLCHRIAHVIIFNSEGEMALQLRAKKQGFFGNSWVTSAGGHVHAGESYEEAAMRETSEELGIVPVLEHAFKDLYETPKVLKLLCTFTALREGPFTPNPREVQKVEFFTLEKIKQMMQRGELFHPELVFLLEKHYLRKQHSSRA